MKLSYWVAAQDDDHKCYHIRAKTKRECEALVAASWRSEQYGPVTRVELEYKDGFDLMMQCLGSENQGHWEYDAEYPETK